MGRGKETLSFRLSHFLPSSWCLETNTSLQESPKSTCNQDCSTLQLTSFPIMSCYIITSSNVKLLNLLSNRLPDFTSQSRPTFIRQTDLVFLFSYSDQNNCQINNFKKLILHWRLFGEATDMFHVELIQRQRGELHIQISCCIQILHNMTANSFCSLKMNYAQTSFTFHFKRIKVPTN